MSNLTVTVPAQSGELSPEVMAVISAAAAVAIGKKAQVTRIRYRASRSGNLWLAQERASGMHGDVHKSYTPMATTAQSGELSPEVMAVISAAVAVAIGKKAQITRIRYRASRSTVVWSVQGRMTIMSSHITRR